MAGSTVSEEAVMKFVSDHKSALDRKSAGFSGQWLDLQRFVRPGSSVPGGRVTAGGQVGQDVFDSTAPEALEQFAAGLHAYLTSPNDRWFNLTFAATPDSQIGKPEREWFDRTADIMYHHYSLPSAQFDPSLHEAYLDVGSFGTAVIYQDAHPSGTGVVFRTFPLADCKINEDAWGRIETVMRSCSYSYEHLSQLFPGAPAELFNGKRMDDTVDAHHLVVRNPWPDKSKDAIGWRAMPFVSIWWVESPKTILSMGGYRTMPYHVARWAKMSGEVYGRSPGMTALADIKMVNAISKEMIFSAELANRPPMIIEDESLLIPIKSFVPGTLLYKQPGTANPEPIQFGMQPQLAKEELVERRDSIRSAFFIDLLFRSKKKERQSVLEIQDDRAELVRQLTPMFGRLQGELLSPMLARTYDILLSQGVLAEAPFDTGGRMMEVTYTNPAARAQVAGRAMSIGQFLTDITAMAQVDPTVFDVINMSEAASELAVARDVPARVLRSAKEIAAIQQQRAQARAQAQQTQQAVDLSGAVKNVAQARAVDPAQL